MLLCGVACAEQQYNPNNGKWETIPDNSNWQSEYNANEGTWSLQPQGNKTEYNPHSNTWENSSGHESD